MYFLYKKQILTKWNFKPILHIGSDNWIPTIQLFSPNYSNSLNSIWKPENERIRIPNSAIRTQLFEQFEQYTNSLTNYKLFAIFVIRICLLSHILAIIFINVNESMTLQCIFCTKNKFLQSGILIQSSSLDLIIGFLLFSYSALTIRIVRIVFGNQKMNEYEYRIPLFGPNYSNSRIVRIIRSNTACNHYILPE